MPNTYHALLKAIIDATAYARKPENRKEIAEAIAPANYLNQPVTVVEQVLTGTFADGLGNVRKVPDRIDFDPFPWHSFAVWILTQMKRWGQIKGDVDYQKVAREVFLATDAAQLMAEVGLTPPKSTYKSFSVMGSAFDPMKPEDYVDELRDQAGVRCGCARWRRCSRCCFLGAAGRRVAPRHAAEGRRRRRPMPSTRSSSAHRRPAAPSRRSRRPPISAQAAASTYATRSTTAGRTTRASACSSPIRSARVLLGFSLAALVAVPLRVS